MNCASGVRRMTPSCSRALLDGHSPLRLPTGRQSDDRRSRGAGDTRPSGDRRHPGARPAATPNSTAGWPCWRYGRRRAGRPCCRCTSTCSRARSPTSAGSPPLHNAVREAGRLPWEVTIDVGPAVHARAASGAAGGGRRAAGPGLPDQRGRRRGRGRTAETARRHVARSGEARRVAAGRGPRRYGRCGHCANELGALLSRRGRGDGTAVRGRGVGRRTARAGRRCSRRPPGCPRRTCTFRRCSPADAPRTAVRVRRYGQFVRPAALLPATASAGQVQGAADRVARRVRGAARGQIRDAGPLGAPVALPAVDVGPLRTRPVRRPARGQAR